LLSSLYPPFFPPRGCYALICRCRFILVRVHCPCCLEVLPFQPRRSHFFILRLFLTTLPAHPPLSSEACFSHRVSFFNSPHPPPSGLVNPPYLWLMDNLQPHLTPFRGAHCPLRRSGLFFRAPRLRWPHLLGPGRLSRLLTRITDSTALLSVFFLDTAVLLSDGQCFLSTVAPIPVSM